LNAESVDPIKTRVHSKWLIAWSPPRDRNAERNINVTDSATTTPNVCNN
jgi:hypothetical protein